MIFLRDSGRHARGGQSQRAARYKHELSAHALPRAKGLVVVNGATGVGGARDGMEEGGSAKPDII